MSELSWEQGLISSAKNSARARSGKTYGHAWRRKGVSAYRVSMFLKSYPNPQQEKKTAIGDADTPRRFPAGSAQNLNKFPPANAFRPPDCAGLRPLHPGWRLEAPRLRGPVRDAVLPKRALVQPSCA